MRKSKPQKLLTCSFSFDANAIFINGGWGESSIFGGHTRLGSEKNLRNILCKRGHTYRQK